MILGAIEGDGYVQEVWRMEEQGAKWEECALGSFYVKPNYPGRSSHVCNGGFLVTEAARNKGVGRLMGEGYLEWAPRLVSSESVIAAGALVGISIYLEGSWFCESISTNIS